MERRLAAVLIADVAGYSRLSRLDEEGTRANFQSDLHDILEPQFAEHHGRLVKTMGDGLLVEFRSVVDALRCAVEIQQRKAEQADKVTTDRRLDFRIGINLGDIIVEGDDIHGDGVNTADRVQGLAEPGGIAISGTAYDQVRLKLSVGYASLGEQTVRGMAEPIRVYHVLLDPDDAGKTIVKDTQQHFARRSMLIAGALMLLLAFVAAWWQPWTAHPAGDADRALCLSPAGPAIRRSPAVHQCQRRPGS